MTLSVGPQHTDMPEEMRVETMELCVTACEKFATNNEVSVSSVASFNRTLRWALRDLPSVHAQSIDVCCDRHSLDRAATMLAELLSNQTKQSVLLALDLKTHRFGLFSNQCECVVLSASFPNVY